MNPSLSIVTPIYNATKTLKAYLDSIFNSEYQDFELIIVDGMSSDFPEGICKDYKVIFEQIDHQCESDHKRNRGVQLARAEIVLFLDADIVVLPTSLGDIMNVFKAHPEIAGLIGSYDDAPGAQNITSQFKFLLHHYMHQQEAKYIESFWSGCGAIKKSVFNSLGGFNASYLHGGSIQDIEFGYRLKKNNYQIYNAKHIQVKHLKKLNLWEWIYTDICVRGVPWILVMLTYRDLSLKLNANVKGVVSVLSAWLMVFLLGASFFNKSLIYEFLVMLVLFLIINRGVLRFFAVKKNILFTVISTFYLFVYYINCGFCVLVGPLYYAFKKR